MTVGKDYHKSLLIQSTSYSSKQLLKRMYPTQIVKPTAINITENDLILGYKTADFTSKSNVALMNIDLFSSNESGNVAIGFLGVTGTMKSGSAWMVAEDFVYRHDNCLFVLSVKPEAHFHKKPLYSMRNLDVIDNILSTLGLQRQGLDLLIIAPKGIVTDINVDRYFSISWKWIKDLAARNKPDALRIFALILGLNPNDDDSIDLLARGIEDNKIKSLNDFLGFVNKIQKDTRSLYYAGSSKVLRKLKPKMDKKTLSDDLEYSLDLLEEMKKRQGKGGVVFLGLRKVAGSSYIDSEYEGTIQACQSLILEDGYAWNLSRDGTSVLKCDTTVMIEELDTLAPNDQNNFMSLYERGYATRSRQAGINPLFVVQEADTVDSQLWAQVKIFFCAKLSEGNGKMFERRGLPKSTVSYLKGLKMDIKPIFNGRPIGYTIPERVVITQKNEIIVYCARPPQSQFPFKE